MMARVPTYDNFQAAPTVSPDAPVQEQTAPNAAQIQGDQLQQLGAATQRSGEAASHIAIQMQDMANQVRVNDAVNKARQAAQDLAYNPDTGYLNLKGDAALTRPDGQDLQTEYGDKLREQLGAIGATLGNSRQREQFAMNASDLSAQFHGQVESHMLGEFRSHALSVQDGTINLASDDAKRNWQNPDLIGPSLEAAKAAVYQKGQVSGWSASQTQAAMLTTTSKVHTDVIAAALENNNPNYALTYLNTRKGEMTADDILRVQGHVNQQVWQGMALGAVQGATTKAMPAVAPTNFDRMTQITAMSESGNRETNPDGSTVTSPKGALGSMQVMPATMKAPGLGMTGIDPATATPEQRAQFGRDYLQTLMQRYGDPAKAWAAYNGGPGRLDDALKAGPDWLSKMPAETQAYVAKNVSALGAPGGGQPPRPTELDFVNNALAALPPGSPPQVTKMTRDQAVAQFGVINKSINEQGDNVVAQAQRLLSGSPNMTVEQLPPAILDSMRQYAPGKIDDLYKYAKALGRGDVVTNNSRYNDIVSHLSDYAKVSDPAWNMMQTELSQTDFRRLSQQRADLQNGKTNDTSEGMNRAAISRALNENLATLKIPTAVGKDADAGERLGGIRKFVDQSILDAQQGSGKKLTPAEIVDHVNGLFSSSVEFKNTLFGVATGGTSAQNLMSMRLGDLPSGAAEGLRTALVKQGNKAPSDTDVLNLYRKLHVK